MASILLDLKSELDRSAQVSALRQFHVSEHRTPGRIEIQGNSCIDFTSWDYLGLRTSASVLRAIHQELDISGATVGSARLAGGTAHAHVACEGRLARFFGAESALLFSSRNQVILSLIAALCGERDAVIADELLTSPAADAAYLVHAAHASFAHASTEALATELEKLQSSRRRIVIAEAVSPLTGKSIDIEALRAVAARFDAELVIDESTALGALGSRGAGTTELLLANDVILAKIADLGSSVCSLGTVLAGSAVLTTYLIQRSRTFQNEVPQPPYVARAIEAAISSIEELAARRARLALLEADFRASLKRIGLSPLGAGPCPLVALSMPSVAEALRLQRELLYRGCWVEVLPVRRTFAESAVLRVILTAAHTDRDIEVLTNILARCFSSVPIERA